MSAKKELARLREHALREGWTVTATGGGHWRWVPPYAGAPMVHTASSPSDHRALANVRSLLRKSGLKC